MAAESSNRQRPNGEPGGAQRCHRTFVEFGLNACKVRNQQPNVNIRSLLSHVAKKDNRRIRCFRKSQQHWEVGVCCYNDATVCRRPIHYRLVGCVEKTYVGDVHGVEVVTLEFVGDPNREVGVEKNSQALLASGTSRSLTRAAPYSKAALMSSSSR